MAMTRELSELQVTPVQEVQGEVVVFQLRDREGASFSTK